MFEQVMRIPELEGELESQDKVIAAFEAQTYVRGALSHAAHSGLARLVGLSFAPRATDAAPSCHRCPHFAPRCSGGQIAFLATRCRAWCARRVGSCWEGACASHARAN